MESGQGGGLPGPVRLNVPLREPLVPDVVADADGRAGDAETAAWPEPLDGRPDGSPWTRFANPAPASAPAPASGLSAAPGPPHPASRPAAASRGQPVRAAWTERGAVWCGAGDYD